MTDPKPALAHPTPRVDVDRSDLQLPSTILSEGDPGGDDGAQLRPVPAPLLGFDERYEVSDVIGRGGMGEVRACRDRVVGRQVAIKRMREGSGSGPSTRRSARFIREARIQGQLEHPAILPVYDLGVAPDGDPYFTMKRVRGQSLAEVLRAMREPDPGGAPPMSPRRLLTVFSQVCLAVDFIHSRGVVHRDLKPANIMLGAYGEVYVVDWGLAKLLPRTGDEAVTAEPISRDGRGQSQVLGTPGYMAPEQLRTDAPAPIDHRADLYALGAILFELLAGEPLHSGGVEVILVSTLSSDAARPSQRRADVSTELDDLCARALRLNPSQRVESAKAMSEAIESFLDGVRDLERRKVLAGEHAARARGAFEASAAGGEREPEERARAMREVTHALGLDPANAEAKQVLVTLLTQPPRTVPQEAEEAIRAQQDRTLRASTKVLVACYLTFLFYVPFPFILGVRSFTAFGVIACGIASCVIAALWNLSRKGRITHLQTSVHIGAALLTAAISSVIFGPLIMAPMIAMVNGLGYVANFPGRWVIAALLSSAAAVVPFILQVTGVLPETVQITGEAIVSGAWLMAFPPTATAVFLVFCHTVIISLACFFVGRTQRENEDARNALHVQAWHLAQIGSQKA